MSINNENTTYIEVLKINLKYYIIGMLIANFNIKGLNKLL